MELMDAKILMRLMGGLYVTGKIACIAIIIGIIGGIVFGVLMTRKNKLLQWVCRLYLESMRIVPVLVWLYIVYFGLTSAIGVNLSGEVVAILVFALWGIAEMGDIVRGALESLPRHQVEAGLAVGLSDLEVLWYVLMPQALGRILPGAINLATRMIKTTSLVSLIGVVEVVKVGQQIIEVSMLTNPAASFWIYGLIFVLYFILCYGLSCIAKILEKRSVYEG
ncbi:MAG: amino acid ABC transporter permease [Cellulosilyticaceae bacterium]